MARRACLTLLALAILALASAVGSDAAPPPPEPVRLGEVPAWPLWIEAGRGSTAAVLSADGTLNWLRGSDPTEASIRIARSLAGEQLAACGAALLVVDDRGSLRRLPRAPELPVVSAVGPRVSRYHRPACAPDGGVLAIDPLGAVLLLSRELEPRAREEVSALPDAELVIVELGDEVAVAVLSEPTQRYRHGTLGDEVEAAALTLLRLPDLARMATWRPAAPAVIEERRVTAWRTDEAAGLHVTVSDDAGGARLVTLVWNGQELLPVAEGEPLGASQRWLHLIGARDRYAYAVHDPRDGGPFVRYRLPTSSVSAALAAPERAAREPSPALGATSFDLGLASHVDGERLLDRAALVGTLADGGDLLLVPGRDQRILVWVRCDARRCTGLGEVTLPAALATNLSGSPPDGPPLSMVLADRSGTVWRLPLPLAIVDGPVAEQAAPNDQAAPDDGVPDDEVPDDATPDAGG
jgi:hypothetical protein